MMKGTMIMRKLIVSSAGSFILCFGFAFGAFAQSHLWDAEPTLWDAAQQFTMTRSLPTDTLVGTYGAGGILNIEGISNNVSPSSLGINLSNGELKIALSGTPNNVRLTVSKTDIWDRGGDGMQKGAGNLTFACNDFSGAAQPQVATSIQNGVNALTLSKGTPSANLKFLCTRRETNTMAINAVCSNIANPITINISRTSVTSGNDGQYFWINRSFKADPTFPNGFQYYFVGKVSGPTATVQVSNGQAVISPGSSLSFTVYATVVTTAEAADPLAQAKLLLTSAVTQGFDSLTAGNQAWFQALYQRREQGRIFTGNFDDVKNYILPYCYEGCWQFRHSYWSSPDPTKFEGDAIYNPIGSDNQPWGGVPCFNEELYTGDYVAGRDESIAPYYVKIYSYWLPGFKLNAQARGKPGACNFRGYIPPVLQHQYQNGYSGGACDYCTMAWGFKNVWDEYDYGGRDDAFLRDSVYPTLSAMADFMAASVNSGSDGYYHIEPSMVREQDVGRDAMDCVTTIKWFFKRAIQAAKTLGVDSVKQVAWQEHLDKMAPYYILSDGRWAAVVNSSTGVPYSCPTAAHSGAHMCVNVTDEYNLESSAQDKNRCITSNNATGDWADPTCRLVEMLLGYGPDTLYVRDFAWITIFAYNSWLYYYTVWNGFPYTNGFFGPQSVSKPVLNSTPRKVAACWLEPERLCNSRSGTIFFFPCIPTGLDIGFKDLQARGGFLVTAERKGGVATYALVKSRRSGPCAVMNPWPGQTLYVTEMPGGAQVTTTVAANKYTFSTTAGRSYTLSTTPVSVLASAPRIRDAGWRVRISKKAIGVVIPGLTSGSTVRIRLIDMQGRCACMTVQPCGHEVVLNTRGLARGLYFLHVKGQGFERTSTIALLQ
jgi:hypothetical protein